MRAKRALSLSFIQELARKKGGWCLSKVYRGANSPLRFKCGEGHTWVATPNGLIYRGRWCGRCQNNVRLTIKDCQRYARHHGGECLSKRYKNNQTYMKWRCSMGHAWKACFGWMKKQNAWCEICSTSRRGVKRRLSITEPVEYAKSKGGFFLSEVFEGVFVKYKWKCAFGHIWESDFHHIQRGQWCPLCLKGHSERCTRICFEKLFSAPFPKTRPRWMLMPSGRTLELDGYNEGLRLAFEHQGRFHYEFIKHFHGSEYYFKKRLLLDKKKKALCRGNGVSLICVPELGSLLPLGSLKSFVIKEAKRLKIPIPQNASSKIIDYSPAFITSQHNYLADLHAMAKKKGGSCMAKKWLGWKHKYPFKCSSGHEWKTTPDPFLRLGTWCPKCAGFLRWEKRKAN